MRTIQTSRRALLSGGGAVVLASAAVAAPVAIMQKVNPDAELLALDRELSSIRQRLHEMPSEDDPDFAHPMWAEKDALEDRMLRIQPQTGAGIAAFLRIVYDHSADLMRSADGPPADCDWSTKMLWTAIQAAERMASA
ncbi:hypothetical protein [Azospirillum sp.]|uniref:hypothetical protein n=1 Tax=Azospirillum sp. TaxID=34012 RepID=UPI003D7541EE